MEEKFYYVGKILMCRKNSPTWENFFFLQKKFFGEIFFFQKLFFGGGQLVEKQKFSYSGKIPICGKNSPMVEKFSYV